MTTPETARTAARNDFITTTAARHFPDAIRLCAEGHARGEHAMPPRDEIAVDCIHGAIALANKLEEMNAAPWMPEPQASKASEGEGRQTDFTESEMRAAPAGEAVSVAREETAWLIEHQDHRPSEGGPHYFAGYNKHSLEWTQDVNKAVRFARKVDAEAVAGFGVPAPAHHVREHMWLDAAPPPLTGDKPTCPECKRDDDVHPSDPVTSGGRGEWFCGRCQPPHCWFSASTPTPAPASKCHPCGVTFAALSRAPKPT